MSETSAENLSKKTETALVKVEPQTEGTSTPAEDAIALPRRREYSRASRKWVIRLALLRCQAHCYLLPAIISSSTFRDSRFEGNVTEIGAAVNEARGTIQVTVTPPNPPDLLRPGQTVLVPQTALARDGDRTVVYVVQNGIALQKTVVTRPPTAEGVPCWSDLAPASASSLTPGKRNGAGVA